MPLYEYACGACHREFELLIRARETLICPTCGGTRLERLLSVPTAHTSGGGEMPICEAPRVGGCGAPWCGQGACQAD